MIRKKTIQDNWKCFSYCNSTMNNSYRKNPKISDTWKFIVITPNVEQDGVSLE